MGYFDLLGAGRAYPDTRQKDYDFSAELPQNQVLYTGGFVVPEAAARWTARNSYAAMADTLLRRCSVSRACIDQRVIALQNVVLKAEGNADALLVCGSPNQADKTISAALGAWERTLSLCGKLFLMWNMSVPGRPTLQSLRPDLVELNTKERRWEYTPGALNGRGEPELMFNIDGAGNTTAAFQRTGPGVYRPIKAALQLVSYFDPLDSMGGLSPGEAALRSVDVWLAAQDLVARKFQSGGRASGYIRAPLVRSEAEAAKLKSMIESLQTNGAEKLLANGMDWQAAQLSFTELQVETLMVRMAEDICSAFGVSAEMVNTGKSTFANKRGSDKIFWRNWAGPESHWLVDQLQWGLRRYVDARASVSVDETAMQHLEEDLDDKLTKWATAGCFTLDECRSVVGLPPLPNGEGKALCTTKAPTDHHTGLGQPDTKPGGDTAFNADSGARGDNNQ